MDARRTYTFLWLFCIFFGVVFFAESALAQPASCPHGAFHVRGVEVAARAGDADEARAVATVGGLEEAWRRLNVKLHASGDVEITSAEVAELIDYTSVVSETVLPRYYGGVFNYCFDRGKVRGLFAEAGITHAEIESAPMLVLPVWHDGTAPRIWRQPNPWADAWREIIDARDGLANLGLSESIAIKRSVLPEDVFAGRRRAIAEAAEFEDAERVIVAVFAPASGDGGFSVSARLYTRAGLIESDFYNNDDVRFAESDTSAVMLRIAGEIENGIESVWRDVHVINFAESLRHLTVEVTAGNVADWREQLDVLRVLDPVERVDVLQVSPRGGVVRLTLSASAQSLSYALEAEGYSISEAGGNGAASHRIVAHDR